MPTIIEMRDLAARWVLALIDLYDTFVANNIVNVLDIIIDMLDSFPITDLINIILIPFRNIIDGTIVGDLTVLEFTLGFGIGIYLLFTFFRWIWNTFPVV